MSPNMTDDSNTTDTDLIASVHDIAGEGSEPMLLPKHYSTTIAPSIQEEQISPTTTTESPICHKYSSHKLNSMLEEVGGYNQRFMANSPDEAGHRFHDFLPRKTMKINDAIDGIKQGWAASKEDLLACNDECKTITELLSDAIKEEQPMNNGDEGEVQHRVFDTGPREVQEGTNSHTKTDAKNANGKACSLDRFIPLGDCQGRGSEEMWGYEQLCSACHGVYMLQSNCFPQFLNSITCDRKDMRCIFDWWTVGDSAHGKCQERTLPFSIMRNIGTVDCQHWQYETLLLPVSCQCYLSRASWLKA